MTRAYDQADYRNTRKERLENTIPKCVVCGSIKHMELDHKIPVDAGGTNDADNMQWLCRWCNRSKGSREYSNKFDSVRGVFLDENHPSNRAERTILF